MKQPTSTPLHHFSKKEKNEDRRTATWETFDKNATS